MAVAYNHLGPYQRLVSFIGSKLSELEHRLIDAVDEQKMWDESSLQPYLQNHTSFVTIQRLNLGALRASTAAEINEWKKLLQTLRICVACSGRGEYYVSIDQDDGYYQKCDACKSTGRRPG